jgi:hypothetical protein
MSASTITISLGLFLLAGFFEIAGGWLVWQWIRDLSLGHGDYWEVRSSFFMASSRPFSQLTSVASTPHTVVSLLSYLSSGVGSWTGTNQICWI